MKFITDMKILKRILIVTNDSNVFLNKSGVESAFNMFGGRMIEVKNLVARLDTAITPNGKKLCDVAFGVISTKYGFVPGNYMISYYKHVMSDIDDYIETENRKNYIEQV